ncbi:phage integrase family protein [mine drainage metagenome]|uniref:Phage integrase family protein n=1 Tax=mine drainage metagenome TaxID=410659 RepID=A0A1J5PZ24_9ZZZZ
MKILEALPRNIKGEVFKMRDDAVTQSFERVVTRCRAAHIKKLTAEKKSKPADIDADPAFVNLRFHDLRHEATSRLAEKLSVHELAKVTGHRDLRMLMRYFHPRAEDLAKKLG